MSWTEEGHRFSWHRKLRDKNAKASFFVFRPGSAKILEANPAHYLTNRQHRKMRTRPDMILQFAHHLEDEFQSLGYREIEVRAVVMASLNGREFRHLVDPMVDLSQQKRSIFPSRWVLPLRETSLSTQPKTQVDLECEMRGSQVEVEYINIGVAVEVGGEGTRSISHQLPIKYPAFSSKY